jgi:hypothetical protein
MGRKSPVLLLKWRRPVDSRQAIWDAIRAAGLVDSVSLEEIERETRIHQRTIRDYLGCLTAAGIVELTLDPKTAWRLVDDQGMRAPRVRTDGTPVTQGQGRANAWKGIRILKRFTMRDLHAATGTAESDLKSYLPYLVKAGYLRLVEPGSRKKGGSAPVYMLDPRRNSGPEAPQVTRLKAVFDANTETVVWPDESVVAETEVEGA